MIKIHSIHFDSDKKLETFIESKVNKLIKLDSNIIGAEIFLRLEKSQDKDNKVTEIRLEVPGYDLFAEQEAEGAVAATGANLVCSQTGRSTTFLNVFTKPVIQCSLITKC